MKSNTFKVHEFVPEHIFNKYKEKSWRFIPIQMIETAEAIKRRFPNGSMTINNYFWGGDREWSGLRTPVSPWYSETSMHSFALAFDCVFSEYDVNEVRQYIIDNPEEFPHVKGIEMGISWLHVDFRNEETVQLFYP